MRTPSPTRRAHATRLLALTVLCLAPTACRRGGDDGPAPVDRSDGRIPELRAPHTAPHAVRVDGRLDEPAWNTAGTTGGFVNPGSGRPEPGSRVRAEAKVLWDDENLYVGFVVRDADPAAPFARDAVDPHLWEQSSAVELMIQPGDPGDNTGYFELQVDTAGAVWDTRFDDYNRPITMGPEGRRFGHQEWDARMQRAAVVDRDAGRYTIEVAIPWASLANPRAPTPPRDGDAWRVNFYSFRDGQRDSLAWSPLMGQGNFHRASRFGRVRFAR